MATRHVILVTTDLDDAPERVRMLGAGGLFRGGGELSAAVTLIGRELMFAPSTWLLMGR